MRCAAPFADGPDDQALPAAHVACGEDSGDAGHVVLVHLYVAARIKLEPELPDRAIMLGADKAQRQEAKVAVELEFAAGDFGRLTIS